MSDLAERIERLEHIEQIKTLKYRYWRACDNKDPRGFREAFIDRGAVIDYGPLGSFDDADGIAAVYEAIALRKNGDTHVILDMHHGMHPDIRITGPGAAEGRWTLRFRQLNLTERTETVSSIEYFDTYAVEDGRWKIASCKAAQLWSMTTPLGDDVVVTESLPISDDD